MNKTIIYILSILYWILKEYFLTIYNGLRKILVR